MESRFLFDEGLGLVDPDVEAIIRAEQDRQRDKLILIPSESLTPKAVREALGSVFTSIYAEGYPARRIEDISIERLLDRDEQLAYHRRCGDRRFYKGTEMADLIESLARKRVAELFATDGQPGATVKVGAEEIFANVQALSGAAANNAVYEALLQPGDMIMGMSLNHGGHLTHGSPVNRSGKYHKVVPYGVNLKTGRLDYDEMAELAVEHRPNIIVAGATAYPWEIDWRRLRQIADAVPGGAYLLADISHPAGLVAAGLFPNPVGYADVVTFTTHKTLLGPRAAVILSTDRDIADRIDRAVFPGEQGGPHLQQIAAMAVAFKLAQGEAFRQVQEGIVANAAALAKGLQERGLTLAGGGTSTHLLLVDLNSIVGEGGFPLKGDVAARILDICGLVCNRNTIPGDVSAGQASGIRLGAVWLTQRGYGPGQMDRLAALIQRVLSNIRPFAYIGAGGPLGRGRIDFEVIREARGDVGELVDWAKAKEGEMSAPKGAKQPMAGRPFLEVKWAKAGQDRSGAIQGGEAAKERASLEVSGDKAGLFLQEACAGQILDLAPGQRRVGALLTPDGEVMSAVEVTRVEDDKFGRRRYALAVPGERAAIVQEWLEALSDGYVRFDPEDILAKVDGPVVVRRLAEMEVASSDGAADDPAGLAEESKPYFVGQRRWAGSRQLAAKPEFQPEAYAGPVRKSCLYEEHLRLNGGRNMASFAGWTMPLWYTGIGDEHHAVRKTAALFDVTHMGVLEIRGPGAERFLDLVTANYVPALQPGQAQYSYVLDPNGQAIDDVFVYRRDRERFMLVVNAANAERVRSWLEAVSERRWLIDRRNPAMEVDATATVRDLKDPASGADRRVDLALQGPRSLRILQSLVDPALTLRLSRLGKSEFVEGMVGGVEALISRTGYTGEEVGFELYVHPDQAPALWWLLLERGAEHGLKPAGLGARDSTRIEGGFPLYGQELAGTYGISPIGAGYGHFVKLHKPFFVGRAALIAAEAGRTQQVVRYAMDSRGIRAIRPGDPVVNRRGQCIGFVTSGTAVEGRQVGLAYVDRRYAEEGTPIAIYPLPRGTGRGAAHHAPAELKLGEDMVLPESGRILSRFGLAD